MIILSIISYAFDNSAFFFVCIIVIFRLKVTTLFIWTMSFERSSSLSEFKKEIDLRISNRISTKTGSRPI